MPIITPYIEVCQLRQEGNYQAAYERALKVKKEMPGCQWVNPQIAWGLHDMLNANSDISRSEEFLLRLQEYADLCKEVQTDMGVTKRIVWPIRSFIVSCCKDNSTAEDLLYRTFGIMQQITFDTSDQHYGILLGAFIKAKQWRGLKSFIEWWDLDNIKDKDCEPYKTDSGRLVMSTCEQAYIAYSKCLLTEMESGLVEPNQVSSFIDRLATVEESHPEFQYTSYFKAKLLLGLSRHEDAITALKPFIKKKSNEYWVWDLLGDAEKDEELRISCYCKALTCPSKDQFLIKIHYKLCDLLLKKELYEEARAELDAAIAITRQNEWNLPYKYQYYVSEAWYLNSKHQSDNAAFYKEHSSTAEQLAYTDNPEYTVVITHINKEKQFASFVSIEHKKGFFSCKNKSYRVGDILRCRMEKDYGSHYVTYTSERVDIIVPELIKVFSGSIRKSSKGFGIADGVFIPDSLLVGIDNHAFVSGKSFPSFDKKKGEWGWTAFQINC